jgi:hypothetical protein
VPSSVEPDLALVVTILPVTTGPASAASIRTPHDVRGVQVGVTLAAPLLGSLGVGSMPEAVLLVLRLGAVGEVDETAVPRVPVEVSDLLTGWARSQEHGGREDVHSGGVGDVVPIELHHAVSLGVLGSGEDAATGAGAAE